MSDETRPAERDAASPFARWAPVDAEAVLAQVAGAQLTGAPLAAALHAAGSEAVRPAVRRTLHDLSNRVARGEPLDGALAAAAPELPPYVADLLRLAARDPRGGALLTDFVNAQREERLLRREIAASIAYPAFLLVFALVVCALLPSALAQDMHDMYREMGVALPKEMQVSQWIALWGPTFLAATGVAALIVATVLRLSLGADGFRSLQHGLPLIGSVWRNLAIARWARALGLLVEGRVPLADALRATSVGLGDVRLGQAVTAAARRVDAGASLADALAAEDEWTEGLISFVRHGETTRLLPEALESVALLCDQRARLRGRWFRLAFPGLVFVLIAHAVLFSYFNLTRPIIELISKLT